MRSKGMMSYRAGLAALACAYLVSSLAWAQDGFVFEEDEVEQIAAPAAPVARYLQEGLAFYEADDFYNASIYFWMVLQEEDVSADSLRPRAQFELARALAKLSLMQGSLYWFDEIIAAGSSHPYFEPSAPWMISIARELPGDAEMLYRVAAFSELFPDRIEEKYRDEMAYMLGEHYLQVGELEEALRYLNLVSEVSPFFDRSLFLAGVTYVRLFDAESAVLRFGRLLQRTERGRTPEERRLHELAMLSAARTYYSAGDYPNAMAFYEDIERDSEYWLDSLFESSWAYFQADQYNRALGNLHSLNSPFFNDEYYPEAPVLQAVIFFMNCRYEEAREVVDEFGYVYPPLRDELREAREDLTTDEDHYQFLVDVLDAQERRFDPRLQQIVNATLSDSTLSDAIAFIDELDRELLLIESADPAWADYDLANYLYGEILATRDLSMQDAGRLVRSRLDKIAEELGRNQRDMSAILVETDLAEANAISADLRAELVAGGGTFEMENVSREEMFWTFDGEYWKDELGYYYYHITSACQ